MVKASEKPRAAGLAIVGVSLLAAAVFLAVQLALTPVPPFPQREGLLFALLSGFFEAGYIATLLVGLQRAGLPVVYTIARGGALLIVWPISVIAMGEGANAIEIGAALALLAGLLLCGLEGTRIVRGAGWGAACAVFVAGYHLTYKASLAQGSMPAGVFTVSLALAMPVNWILQGPTGRADVVAACRARPAWVIGGGLVCAASFLTFLFALRDTGAGLAFSLRNTSVVFAAVLGWALGEPRRAREMAGVLVVAASAVALAWAGS